MHEGIAPPNDCPSCGAPADRFRPMDSTEVSLTIGEMASYGRVGQGFDIDIDDTRRLRLLAFIDASFYAPFMNGPESVIRSHPATPSGSRTTSRA